VSGYAKSLLRLIEMSKSPFGVGVSTRGDMRFMADCIISGTYCKPFRGVY